MQNMKINLLVICMVIILSLSLSACGAPKVKHNDDPLWDVELEGANPEFVEDYIYMWDVLENEYPLLSAAERLTGKDIESIKESYYKRIQHGVDDPKGFFSFVINPCLNEFAEIGHLSAYNDWFYEYQYSRFKVYEDTLKQDVFGYYDYKQITSPQSKEFYGDVIEKVDTYISQGGDITESDTFISPSDNLHFEYYPEQSAAYVEIKSMNTYDSVENPEYKALSEFFTKIEKEGYKNCIIDIRPNSGGSTMYWKSGIVFPNCTEQLSTKNYGLIKGDICKKYLDSSSWVTIRPISELPTEDMPDLNKDDLNESTYFWETNDEYTSEECGDAKFSGKFWLLTSEKVYSASEAFAVFCKNTGFATLVGTRTRGDGIGFSPITFSLPNTGICFRFSASNGLNANGSGNEEFGTTPDYEISEGEDALEKCLQLIAEGK